MTRVYKLAESPLVRLALTIKDAQLRKKLVAGSVADVDATLRHNAPIEVEVEAPFRGAVSVGLDECDLYKWGHFPVFAVKVVEAICELRGVKPCLVELDARDGVELFLFSSSRPQLLITMDSTFRMEGTANLPSLFLERAVFRRDAHLEFDIFWIQHPQFPQLHVLETFVTQPFVDCWKRNRFVGAEFEHVGDLWQ